VWTSNEQASFKAVIAPFISQSKITINIESTRDLNAVLALRIKGDNLPDIAILPNSGTIQQLAAQHKLVNLASFMDMDKIYSNYTHAWIDLGSYNGRFYALPYKAANKGTIWYSPAQFKSIGVHPPTTWIDLITLSDKIAHSGQYPWSMGVESGSASGWPAADWVAEIYLNQSGSVMYEQWVAHKIPWTHSSVKRAFQAFGQIVGGRNYINDAPQAVLETNFQTATYIPFLHPPGAYMCYLGDFAVGFVSNQFPHAKPGLDFDFFPFPTIDPRYQGSITGGADLVVAMKDSSAVREFIQYLATADAQTIWVKRGGFTSPNKAVDLTAYPSLIAQASARMLTSATTFHIGAGDLMPPAVQLAFWKGMLTFISDQTQLDNVLSTIEATAQGG
jgi:alpha-glucoside transport system substrate-binding protein